MGNPSHGIRSAEGTLGVALVGLGAVSTTFVAGVELIRKGKALPIGSQAWIGRICLGEQRDGPFARLSDVLPLASPEDLVFAAWDIFPDSAHEAALKAGVLERQDLREVEEELAVLRPMAGAFDGDYVRNLSGTHVKRGTRRELANALREDIRAFAGTVDRMVVVWAASTEQYRAPGPIHRSLAAFEDALDADDRDIAPSQLYAYAALMEGIPFANGAPNPALDFPAMIELAREKHVPVCGRDFKTGQTLLKTIVAPGLRSRLLGISGWFSTNILGNRDGEVLADPGSRRSKELSKAGVLDGICDGETYPELYGNLQHRVRLDYHPPRGDAKESWDSIDIFGWLGYQMEIKINFLCRDSILAAPVVADVSVFLDLAARAGLGGAQEWLSFYFKCPQTADGSLPEHDLRIQQTLFEDTLCRLADAARVPSPP